MTQDYGSVSPVPYEWSAADDLEQDQELVSAPEEWRQERPVLVQNVKSENVAPDATSFMTWSIPAAPAFVQICPHRYQRYKAKFCALIPATTTLLIAKTPEALSGGSTSTAFAITNAFVPGTIPDYDGVQPLYAAFTGTGPVTVAVMDEGFKAIQ